MTANHPSFFNHPAPSWLISQFASTLKSDLLVVLPNDEMLVHYKREINYFAPLVEVKLLPAWDNLPFSHTSPHSEIMRRRLQTLAELLNPNRPPTVVLVCVSSLVQRVLPPELISKQLISLKTGDKIDPQELALTLVTQGFMRTTTATEAGEFAVRGSIIDIVVANHGEGYRLDLFGNQIESIRLYNTDTQLSSGSTRQFQLIPSSEVLLTPEQAELFVERFRRIAKRYSEIPLFQAVKENTRLAGMEQFLPLFYSKLASVADYLPNARIMDFSGPSAFDQHYEQLHRFYDNAISAASRELPVLAVNELYLSKQEIIALLDSYTSIKDDSYSKAISLLNPEVLHNSGKNLTEWLSAFRLHYPKERLIIACTTTGSRERLRQMLVREKAHVLLLDSWDQLNQVKGKSIGLVLLPFSSGFVLNEQYAVISEASIFGEKLIRSTRRSNANASQLLAEASSFKVGDYLVHRDHGIGRCEGLTTLTVSGTQHDCLCLVYENGDKLYVPVENIDLLSSYGSESPPLLDKLGNNRWQERKTRLKRKLFEIADKLISIAAIRQTQSAPTYTPDTGVYEEFCARFSYTETEDQLNAIDHIAEDLARGKPMDRLICGDVGFGKTEVALRAAMMVLAGGKGAQVAILAPTTLLARQHYQLCSMRFKGFSIKIAQLSRLVSAKEANQIKQGLEVGEIDLVIGTHSLLSNVKFKNLALLIIDEEQHFGVAQKEKLKEMRKQAHVLTMTATPIPRTLQLSMTGIKDLSIIATPPVDRLVVKTFVTPYDATVIKQAIEYERNRGGKCFYVAPRVNDLEELELSLRQLIPDLKFAVVHGQMKMHQLETEVNKFYEGHYHLLLATNIVESGLDIPAANTIIVHNAHLFGLSQLYQLRGRVGRGKLRAFAYLTHPSKMKLSDLASKRLSVMQKLDSLGAGFTIASHDMDIRGYGNVVGEEQSGHIREVGAELYQEMLQEELERQRTAASRNNTSSELEPPTSWSPQLNLGITVLIPASYLPELDLRLAYYRRLSQTLTANELEALAAEMIDRFGPLPVALDNLLSVIKLKQLARQAYIAKIDVGPKGVVISFYQDSFPKIEALLTYVASRPAKLKFRNDNKLVLMHEWKENEDKLSVIEKLISELGKL